MASKKSISLVKGSNWQGVYINGQLVTDGWMLDIHDLEKVLKALKVQINVVNHDDAWLSKACLPRRLKDVKRKRK